MPAAWGKRQLDIREQALDVQKVDSAIQCIIHLTLLIVIRWIVIYPVDSAIHLLNNWGQVHISRKSKTFPGPKSSAMCRMF